MVNSRNAREQFLGEGVREGVQVCVGIRIGEGELSSAPVQLDSDPPGLLLHSESRPRPCCGAGCVSTVPKP